MRVRYRKRFLKDLAAVPSERRAAIEAFAFDDVPAADSLSSLRIVEQMRGYAGYFKVRFGSYRVGLRVQDDVVVLERALHRKDIYRRFP